MKLIAFIFVTSTFIPICIGVLEDLKPIEEISKRISDFKEPLSSTGTGEKFDSVNEKKSYPISTHSESPDEDPPNKLELPNEETSEFNNGTPQAQVGTDIFQDQGHSDAEATAISQKAPAEQNSSKPATTDGISAVQDRVSIQSSTDKQNYKNPEEVQKIIEDSFKPESHMDVISQSNLSLQTKSDVEQSSNRSSSKYEASKPENHSATQSDVGLSAGKVSSVVPVSDISTANSGNNFSKSLEADKPPGNSAVQSTSKVELTSNLSTSSVHTSSNTTQESFPQDVSSEQKTSNVEEVKNIATNELDAGQQQEHGESMSNNTQSGVITATADIIKTGLNEKVNDTITSFNKELLGGDFIIGQMNAAEQALSASTNNKANNITEQKIQDTISVTENQTSSNLHHVGLQEGDVGLHAAVFHKSAGETPNAQDTMDGINNKIRDEDNVSIAEDHSARFPDGEMKVGGKNDVLGININRQKDIVAKVDGNDDLGKKNKQAESDSDQRVGTIKNVDQEEKESSEKRKGSYGDLNYGDLNSVVNENAKIVDAELEGDVKKNSHFKLNNGDVYLVDDNVDNEGEKNVNSQDKYGIGGNRNSVIIEENKGIEQGGYNTKFEKNLADKWRNKEDGYLKTDDGFGHPLDDGDTGSVSHKHSNGWANDNVVGERKDTDDEIVDKTSDEDNVFNEDDHVDNITDDDDDDDYVSDGDSDDDDEKDGIIVDDLADDGWKNDAGSKTYNSFDNSIPGRDKTIYDGYKDEADDNKQVPNQYNGKGIDAARKKEGNDDGLDEKLNEYNTWKNNIKSGDNYNSPTDKIDGFAEDSVNKENKEVLKPNDNIVHDDQYIQQVQSKMNEVETPLNPVELGDKLVNSHDDESRNGNNLKPWPAIDISHSAESENGDSFDKEKHIFEIDEHKKTKFSTVKPDEDVSLRPFQFILMVMILSAFVVVLSFFLYKNKSKFSRRRSRTPYYTDETKDLMSHEFP